jgi:GNAT superfamily N-acetyltransferase
LNFNLPGPLSKRHVLENFDCGENSLNNWVRKFARDANTSGGARVYVTTPKGSFEVAGIYALAAASFEPADATTRLAKGQPRNQKIPVVLLARLAVERKYHGRGIGSDLLRDAMIRTVAASDLIGGRALVVHAKNPAVTDWYMRYNFEQSPVKPLHLMLLMKDLRAFLNRSNPQPDS